MTPAAGATRQGATDATPVRDHLRHIMTARGLGRRRAALLAGLSPDTVGHVLYGGASTVRADIATRILAVTPDTPMPPRAAPADKTDATGTRRRIRALHCDGHSAVRIGAELGRRPAQVLAWLRYATIDTADARAVADIYARWAGVRAEDLGADPADAAGARAMARRRRWAPAPAWDHETIDDRDAAPASWRTTWRAADLHAESEPMLAAGTPIDVVAAHLGVKVPALKRARERVRARARRQAAEAEGVRADGLVVPPTPPCWVDINPPVRPLGWLAEDRLGVWLPRMPHEQSPSGRIRIWCDSPAAADGTRTWLVALGLPPGLVTTGGAPQPLAEPKT